MTTAVVILNWNGRDLLKQFLPSVISFSEEANIYVADNASTDDSVAFVKENFPQVKIIQNKENGGFAKGYNDALSGLTEDIFVLLNSDVEVTENWLKPILEIFNNEPKTAALQPKILDFKKKDHFEYAGAAGGFIDKYGYPFCRGRIFETLEKDYGQYNEDVPIFWASGACLVIRKNVYWEAGALDKDFFAHQEEIDLCWRIHNLGYQVKSCGAAIVYHVGGATLDNMNPRKTFFNFRNSLYMLLKNVPAPNVYAILLMRMILDGIAGMKFIAAGKFSHLYAILQAHSAFYRNFKKIHSKRKSVPKNTEYFQLKSIIWSYFCLGKKEFSKLK
ncbi:glycosyltransferase family 2 protein [Salegentibacter sp. JZCK2]|uniref:glycosyltransferase family 2 protein n=1 Tax=Salegentibacter tibetensis TaxID=2873600 RepID=UPI001CCC6247|nr:glycosyltransferase family 2 protein [Salegentibacter tibetensis]MBZ9731056.1 glycosyltransferase family 2 protein [Salegentibacter tibetensis]